MPSFPCTDYFFGVCSYREGYPAYIVKRKIHPPETQRDSNRIQQIRNLRERSPFDQRPRSPRRKPRPRKREGETHRSQHDKPQHPHRPTESDRGEQLPHHGRKHHPSRRGATRRDPDGERPPLGEISRQHRQRRTKQQSVPQSRTDALGEEKLPVRRTPRRREDADELQRQAGGEGVAEEPGVGGAAGERADEEEEEDLHGADPGDVRGGVVESGDVVGLEDAEGVDVAPRVEDGDVAHEDLCPGVETCGKVSAWKFWMITEGFVYLHLEVVVLMVQLLMVVYLGL